METPQVQKVTLPPDPFWLLTVPVRAGESVPFHLWLWWHWQWMIPRESA